MTWKLKRIKWIFSNSSFARVFFLPKETTKMEYSKKETFKNCNDGLMRGDNFDSFFRISIL